MSIQAQILQQGFPRFFRNLKKKKKKTETKAAARLFPCCCFFNSSPAAASPILPLMLLLQYTSHKISLLQIGKNRNSKLQIMDCFSAKKKTYQLITHTHTQFHQNLPCFSAKNISTNQTLAQFKQHAINIQQQHQLNPTTNNNKATNLTQKTQEIDIINLLKKNPKNRKPQVANNIKKWAKNSKFISKYQHNP